MIHPKQPQTTAAVAAHYDELDRFYREIWGDHVHHGYWVTGHESAIEAVEALVALLAQKLQLTRNDQVCDIGCGYGATAAYLAERHAVNVTGVTVSAIQAERARLRRVARGTMQVLHLDWLSNTFDTASFDRAYAIESSEHMPDKPRFFSEAYRILKPGGVFVLYAWLACDAPRPWQVRHMLEPICREGRLPSMGDEADYRGMGEAAGFDLVDVEDLSRHVRRTWSICLQRLLTRLVTRASYIRFMLDSTATNRSFAVTVARISMAYRTRSLRYCQLVFRRPTA